MFFIVAGQEKCPARSEIEYKVTEKPRHSVGFPAMFCVFLDVHQLFYGVHHLQRRASSHEYGKSVFGSTLCDCAYKRCTGLGSESFFGGVKVPGFRS